MILLLVTLPSSGAASAAACTLGAAAGRNRLGSLFTSLPSPGSATMAATVTASQPSTTSQRNRTANPAITTKNPPALSGPGLGPPGTRAASCIRASLERHASRPMVAAAPGRVVSLAARISRPAAALAAAGRSRPGM